MVGDPTKGHLNNLDTQRSMVCGDIFHGLPVFLLSFIIIIHWIIHCPVEVSRSASEQAVKLVRTSMLPCTFIRLKLLCGQTGINPLNAELNPICCLLALLGAHHFLHVSRIRVKSLTLRLLMSYIYIWSTHS